jgi:hypothetical protein
VKANQLFNTNTVKKDEKIKSNKDLPIYLGKFEPRIAKGSSVILGEWGSGKTYYFEYLKQFINDAIIVEPLNP